MPRNDFTLKSQIRGLEIRTFRSKLQLEQRTNRALALLVLLPRDKSRLDQGSCVLRYSRDFEMPRSSIAHSALLSALATSFVPLHLLSRN